MRIFSEDNKNQGMNKLKLTKDLRAFISKLHPVIKEKIKNGLIAIISDPGIGKNLKEELAGLKSLRIGKFRIIYRPEKSGTISIIAIGPRSMIYEETLKLIEI